LRSALNLLEKRVQTLSAKFPELKIDNVLLMCDSGEAGMKNILRSTLKMDEHLLQKRVQALSLS